MTKPMTVYTTQSELERFLERVGFAFEEAYWLGPIRIICKNTIAWSNVGERLAERLREGYSESTAH